MSLAVKMAENFIVGVMMVSFSAPVGIIAWINRDLPKEFIQIEAMFILLFATFLIFGLIQIMESLHY